MTLTLVAPPKLATITVYRDHHAWHRVRKWWHLPVNLLNELQVARYECSHIGRPTKEEVAFVTLRHPEHHIIY